MPLMPAIPLLGAVFTKIVTTIATVLPKIQTVLTFVMKNVDKIKPMADLALQLLQKSGQLNQSTTVDSFANKTNQITNDDLTGCESSKNLTDKIDQKKLDSSIEVGSDELALATSIMVSILAEKYGDNVINLISFAARDKDFFSFGRISSYLEAVDNGELSLSKVVDYYSSSLNVFEAKEMLGKLMSVESVSNSVDESTLKALIKGARA